MKNKPFAITRWAAALALAFAHQGAAMAQEAAAAAAEATAEASTDAAAPDAAAGEAAAAAEDQGPLNLDEIVVVAPTRGSSKMKASVSVSTLGIEQIEQSGAASVAELLRSVPGVRSESSGGESNANLTVRGVPISAGGARYVQYQEDGLPILQFGDIAFATPDSFLRADGSVERLEVIRGGSASTMATNAPGGIINFISNTGKDDGGSIGVGYGLDFDQTRYDLRYGGALNDNTRFHVAGFFRKGEGAREPGVDVEQGGQIRANLTREFDKGYFTVHVKHLDDHAPTLLPVPVRIDGNGKIHRIKGIDPRDASFYSPYWRLDSTVTRDNLTTSSNVNNGLTAKTDALGFEGEFSPAEGWTLSNKFRYAKNSGRFIGIFPGNDPADVSTTYVTGPKAGQAYNGSAFTAVVFNTSLDKFDLVANDLKLTRTLTVAEEGTLRLSAGLYTSTQDLGVTWNFNQYLLEASGSQPAILDSTQLGANSFDNGSLAFGRCCSNTQDSQYKTTAPYAVVSFEQGALNVDASVRRDEQEASGTFNQVGFTAAPSVTYDPALARIIDYNVRKTSYSVGANYRLNSELALFSRYSEGVAFNADRISFFSALGAVDGSSPVPRNTLKQTEAGVKWRYGDLSTFVTFFQAKTKESNFDVTTQKGSANDFDAKGVELEFGYRYQTFSLGGGLTYTDAEVTDSTDAARENRTPKRQADVIYQLAPSYRLGDLNLGASVIGTTKSKDDGPNGALTVKLPAYAVVNTFASYSLFENTELSVGVNNLFDSLGYTESNDGRQAARSINGRTVQAGLKYSF